MNDSRKDLYLTDFEAFVQKAFRSTQGKKLKLNQPYIKAVVHHLSKHMSGEHKQLLVNLPGRHLKTFISSVCLPAFMLARDPALTFMIVCYSLGISEEIVGQIRTIMKKDWYQEICSTRIKLGDSTKTDFRVLGGGRVQAVSVGSVTGKGAGHIIFDDPHNIDDWDDEQKKEAVIATFEKIMSRRNEGKNTKILVVAHRVSEDDVSDHIITRGDFTQLVIPMQAPDDMEFETESGTWIYQKGETLQPDAYPPDEVDKIRRHHRGPLFKYFYQQGLGPRDQNSKIEISHFPVFKENLGDLLATKPLIVLSIDTANKTESKSSNVIHVYVLRHNHIDLVQAFEEKCNVDRLTKMVLKFQRIYNASLILVENTARGPDLIESLRGKVTIPVWPINPKGSKSMRLREVTHIILAKRVRIKSNNDELETVVNAVTNFPNHSSDDHVDAMTQLLIEAPRILAKITPRSLAPTGGPAGNGQRGISMLLYSNFPRRYF